MNDKIQVEMTLTEATFLRSTLVTYMLDNPEIKNTPKRLIERIDTVFASLDTSDNEKFVDSINAKYTQK